MKRILATLLTLAIAIEMLLAFPVVALAESYHEEIIHNKLYFIEHVGSGKLLDIDDWNINNNGTQLQIWEKWAGHNNQVFGLIDTGDGWKIFSYESMKIVEVRNSSHDECAEVAQWDNHNNKCGRWNIIYNPDGTISFENCESGLYMNVIGNGNSNGTKLIQYHHDGTDAEKFRLHSITFGDVLSAKWTREISEDEIEWSENDYGFCVVNSTGWNKDTLKSYPTPGRGYLMKIEYLDPKTVGEIIKSRAYIDDAWSQIKKAVKEGATERTISIALEKLHVGDVPFLGEGLSILEIILNNEEHKEWNAFLDTVEYDENGRCSGVIVATYSVVKKAEDISSVDQDILARKTITIIDLYDKKMFYQWTGDNFSEVFCYADGMNGNWKYNFK